jgi:hypothetical protein
MFILIQFICSTDVTQFCWALLIVYYIQDYCTSDTMYIGGVIDLQVEVIMAL